MRKPIIRFPDNKIGFEAKTINGEYKMFAWLENYKLYPDKKIYHHLAASLLVRLKIDKGIDATFGTPIDHRGQEIKSNSIVGLYIEKDKLHQTNTFTIDTLRNDELILADLRKEFEELYEKAIEMIPEQLKN